MNLKYPPGRIPAIKIDRSNLTLDLSNTIIEPKYPDYLPLVIGSSVERDEIHAQGEINTDINWLVCDSPTLSAGDLVVIKAGVNYSDPAESETAFFMKISHRDGDKIYFDKYFDQSIRIYESYDELSHFTKYPEKMGEWGKFGGTYKRGLGFDHGIKRVISPVENVTIIAPTIVWPSKSRLYGAWSISMHFCRNVRIINAHVRNPCGSAIHFNWADDCHVDGLKITGFGRSAPYGPGTQLESTTSCTAVSAWGAMNCSVRRGEVTSDNTSLANLEAGYRNILFEDIVLRTSKPAKTQVAPQFGKYGSGRATFENISFDLPTSPSIIFPSHLNNTTIRDLRIIGNTFPDWFSWTRGEYEGKLRVGDLEFGPPREVEFGFIANKDGFEIPYPDGIIMSAEIYLTTRDGIRNITTPNECFLSQSGLILKVDPGSYNIKIGDSYVKYREQLKYHRIWMTPSSKNEIRMKCKLL